ncbi:DsbA family oxidoreductase [Cupriavidus sp. 2MCAB6]
MPDVIDMSLSAAPAKTEPDGMGHTLTIEVFFDFVCPWCLIGKRNLQVAASRLAEARPDVSLKLLWRSHQLLPDTPVGGFDYQAFYLARLGSLDAIARRRAQVRQAGSAAGVDFNFERIALLPNTAAAHDLVAHAAGHGDEVQVAALIERLFCAYFMDGEDIGDFSVLERLGLDSGLDRQGLAEHLGASPGRHGGLVRQLPPAGYAISGVPCFVFNGTQALSGAHPPDTIFEAMLRSVRG